MAPKVNITFREPKPVIHYTDIYDLEHFEKVTAPALFRAMDEAEAIKAVKTG